MRRIRLENANKKIPFVFLTANQSPEEEAACLSMGASDFIPKPIVPAVLEGRISRIMELEEFHQDLQAKVEEKTRQYQELALESIFAIVNIIEAKVIDLKGFERSVCKIGIDSVKPFKRGEVTDSLEDTVCDTRGSTASFG